MAASTVAPSVHAVSVEVDGVVYQSANAADRALGLPRNTTSYRAHSERYPNYLWLSETPRKRPVRRPEDCTLAKPLIEPTFWAFDGGASRAAVLDPNEEPPRVVRRVGWVRCMLCRRFHFSGDVVAVRLCSACGGLGGAPRGADPNDDA